MTTVYYETTLMIYFQLLWFGLIRIYLLSHYFKQNKSISLNNLGETTLFILYYK